MVLRIVSQAPSPPCAQQGIAQSLVWEMHWSTSVKKMNVSRDAGSLKQVVPLVILFASLEGVLDAPCPPPAESGPSCLQP